MPARTAVGRSGECRTVQVWSGWHSPHISHKISQWLVGHDMLKRRWAWELGVHGAQCGRRAGTSAASRGTPPAAVGCAAHEPTAEASSL
eukprot:5455722-Prymnesium_polylepis.1